VTLPCAATVAPMSKPPAVASISLAPPTATVAVAESASVADPVAVCVWLALPAAPLETVESVSPASTVTLASPAAPADRPSAKTSAR
jgi:hypothetical protein